MSLLWTILRSTLSDLWEEALWLLAFNVLWALGTLPGLWLVASGLANARWTLTLLGLVLALPWPLLTFGLYHVAYEVGQGKAIGFGAFFRGGWQMWRQAYVWGGANLLIVTVLVTNATFYNRPGAPFGVSAAGFILSGFFIALLMLWLLLQVFVLAMYPRLERPGWRLAMRNALILMFTQPLPTFFVAVLILMLAGLSVLIPALGLLLLMAVIAFLSNQATAAMLEVERERQERRDRAQK